MVLNVKLHKDDKQLKVNFGQIHEVSDGGYERGYELGIKDGYDNGYKTGQEAGFNEGYESAKTDFEKTNPLNYAVTMPTFQNVDFSDCPDIVVEVPDFNGASINTAFNGTTNLQSVKLVCNVRNNSMSATNAFYASRQLKTIDFSEFNTLFSAATSTFGSCVSLERIIGTLDFSLMTAFINTFGQCEKLEEIRVVLNCIKSNIAIPSGVLSDASVQSIVDGLVDLTGGTTQTLTLHTSVVLRLTETQLETIRNKNWQVA